MFGRKTIQVEYAKAISEIEDGTRRNPQHDVPASLRSSWPTVNPVDQFVFEEFAWFGATLDYFTDEAWSIEETSDTHRRAWNLEAPEYGRRWIIYYNKLELGWTEVSPGAFKSFGKIDDYQKEPLSEVVMRLNFMRFIPTIAAFGILYQAAFLMQSSAGGYDFAREQARLAAESAMTRYMWDVMRAGDSYVPDLEFQVEGSYAIFRETVSHWKEKGVNPFILLERNTSN